LQADLDTVCSFFAEEKLFPLNRKYLKIMSLGATIDTPMRGKFSKSEKMDAKFVRTTSTI